MTEVIDEETGEITEVDGDEAVEEQSNEVQSIHIDAAKIAALETARDKLAEAETEATEARKEVKYRQECLRFAVDAVVLKPLGGFPEGTPMAENESWRQEMVSGLGLTVKTMSRLQGSDITTIGELEDARSQGDDWNAGIKGLGDAGCDEIDEAMGNFWPAWKEKQKTLDEVQD